MRIFVKWLFYIVVVVSFLIVCLIGSIDRTSLRDQSFYHEMMNELDTVHLQPSPRHRIKMGWGKYNLTPSFQMPMAGYKPRNRFETVHDSLFARIIAIDNGVPIFIISADLLLFPPAIKEKIEADIRKVMPDAFLYFSATHTHNGLGGWDDSFAGQFITGKYHEEWVNQTSEGILNTILGIQQKMKNGSIAYFDVDATGYSSNRLAGENGKVDAKLRGIKFIREDSSKAILVTFSAHATSISKKIMSLSGDYPSVLENVLEDNGYDFAMFAAGMVGSHRLDGFAEEDFELIEKAGKTLAEKILSQAVDSKKDDSLSITIAHIPIQFGPSQLRIEKNWKLRDWAFRLLLRPLKGELTLLEMGDIILVGTPCDFSGELSVTGEFDKLSKAKGKKLIITSFNGNYAGYITQDEHYDIYTKKEEVMALNWVGPYFGQYFQDMISKILTKN